MDLLTERKARMLVMSLLLVRFIDLHASCSRSHTIFHIPCLPPLLLPLILTLVIRVLNTLVEIVDIAAGVVVVVLHPLPSLIHIIARLIIIILHTLLSLPPLVLRSAEEGAELVGRAAHHAAHVGGDVFDALLHVRGDVFDGLLVLADVVAGAVEAALCVGVSVRCFWMAGGGMFGRYVPTAPAA